MIQQKPRKWIQLQPHRQWLACEAKRAARDQKHVQFRSHKTHVQILAFIIRSTKEWTWLAEHYVIRHLKNTTIWHVNFSDIYALLWKITFRFTVYFLNIFFCFQRKLFQKQEKPQHDTHLFQRRDLFSLLEE